MSRISQTRVRHAFSVLGVNLMERLRGADGFRETEKRYAAAIAEAKSSYRRMLMANHPDHGGDERKAKLVIEAWRLIEKSRPVPTQKPLRRPRPAHAINEHGEEIFHGVNMMDMLRGMGFGNVKPAPKMEMTMNENTNGGFTAWWSMPDDQEGDE